MYTFKGACAPRLEVQNLCLKGVWFAGTGASGRKGLPCNYSGVQVYTIRLQGPSGSDSRMSLASTRTLLVPLIGDIWSLVVGT